MLNPAKTMRPVSEVRDILKSVGARRVNGNDIKIQCEGNVHDIALQNFLSNSGAYWHGRSQYWTYNPTAKRDLLIAELTWDRNWKPKRIACELGMDVEQVREICVSNYHNVEHVATRESYFVERKRRIKNYLRLLDQKSDPIKALIARTGLNDDDARNLLYSLECA